MRGATYAEEVSMLVEAPESLSHDVVNNISMH